MLAYPKPLPRIYEQMEKKKRKFATGKFLPNIKKNVVI
jgi:hypothetical protein